MNQHLENKLKNLPKTAGVYFHKNKAGEIIYVGKAINIKKRIAGHFTGAAREWNRSNIRNEIHHITFELTGNELIALILESQEIRRIWPKYNLAQKHKTEQWGIFDYADRNEYQRFSINTVARGTQPLITFSSKGDAWNFMWEKVRKNRDPAHLKPGANTCVSFCRQSQPDSVFSLAVVRAYLRRG